MTWKQWRVHSAGCPQESALSQNPELTPLLAAVLHARGIHTEEGIKMALFSANTPLGDPFLMADMEKACQRIQKALENGEKITIFGDYDVDGVTATYLMLSYLRGKGAQVDSCIPDRVEGYGLSVDALTEIAQRGTKLVISVDAGITAVEEAAHAKVLGMDLIITDHHQCGSELPQAVAVINPHRADCRYPYKDLAGVGVAFTLLRALEGNDDAILARYGDAVALGTLADVMPLTGENKRLVAQGIPLLCETENKGLCALSREASLSRALSPIAVSFSLAPRINAAGRMASADEALALFLAETDEEATARARALCSLNDQRREAESELFASAQEMIEAEWDEISENKAIVLCGDGWHPGTIGIVAARLADKYGMPTVLAAREDGLVKGSARSVLGFDLYHALCRACEGLGQCGGHENAAGLIMEAENFPAFKQAFLSIVKEELQTPVGPELDIDCLVTGDLLNIANVRSLEKLAPFGAGNPQPVFALFNAEVKQVIPLSGGKHVKLMVEADEWVLPALCFRLRADALRYRPGDRVDVAFFAEINHYRGQESVQLTVQDLRPAQEQRHREQEAEKTLVQLLTKGVSALRNPIAVPNRSVFATVWRGLQRLAQGKRIKTSPALLYCYARDEENGKATSLDELSVLIALQVFSEAGLIQMSEPAADFNEEQSIVFCNTGSGKVDLDKTDLMLRLIKQSA
jgi:single-stranded-DNA-specific exonuclease